MSIAELGPLGFDGGQGVFNGVPEGATLTIEPGVKIYLHENATFAVNGVLNAVGAPDNMITFTHANCFEHWGNLYFTGEQASESTLEYVRIQYSDDGVKGENAFPHRIANSIIRKVGIYGLKIALREGDHQGIEVVGNTISQGAGVGISIDLGPGATIPQITVRENELSNFYNAGVIIGADEDLTTTPQVVVEHNVFENGFRGIGGGFSAVGNVKYRHNYNSNSVSGSGVQVFWPDNEIMHNFFENTFESAYQLHSARLTD
ncbi:MAG: hypothetical protein QF898_10820, partial [SAR202 cluster bacterium]|nr:hypothetical protein [SAR202 cluster bacterium]